MGLHIAFVHAFREMRSGLRGFILFLGCLSLGVAAIAASGTVNSAVQAGIRADSKNLLGGDMQIRLSWRPINEKERDGLKTLGRISHISYLRTMAKGNRLAPIEIKAVDDAYPLAGTLETSPKEPLALLFEKRGESYGGIADHALLVKLQLKTGDTLKIGEATIQIRAENRKEPDRTSALMLFGPRLIISQEALEASGLIRPGSLYENRYNIALNSDQTFTKASAFLKQKFPESEWKIRSIRDAASSMRRFFDDMSSYLVLVGLASLIVGGIGIANAVKAWMNSRLSTIAIFKCVGASERHLFFVSFIQIIILSCTGILLGVISGAFFGDFGLNFLHAQVPFHIRSGIYLVPLLTSAIYGLLIALLFSLLPLSTLVQISPALLMRRLTLPAQFSPTIGYLLGLFGCGAILIAMIIGTTPRQSIALGFIVGVLIAFILFKSAAEVVKLLARFALKNCRFSSPPIRLGISNLYRPNAMTGSIILSIGLGLTALITIISAEQNVSNQIANDLPEKAPSFYYTDIQKDQITLFQDIITKTPGNTLIAAAPIARGRVVELRGKAVILEDIPAEVKWAVNSDRALTEMEQMPEGTVLQNGNWWPENYQGPTLVSVESKIADGLNLRVGDTLTVNIMGSSITATVASTRKVNWGTMQMNFAFIFSPNTFNELPYMWIATVRSDTLEAEDTLAERIGEALPNATPIRLKEVIENASEIMQMTGKAVRWASLLGIIIGIMVLAGAMLAGQAQRTKEAIILKVIGATRIDILKSYLVEFGILGIVSSAIAAVLGSIASYAVITGVMRLNWVFMPQIILIVILSCTLVTLCAGFIGTWQALGVKASSYLRRD